MGTADICERDMVCMPVTTGLEGKTGINNEIGNVIPIISLVHHPHPFPSSSITAGLRHVTELYLNQGRETGRHVTVTTGTNIQCGGGRTDFSF